jgi:S-adenosylhomocysteine hydrolase
MSPKSSAVFTTFLKNTRANIEFSKNIIYTTGGAGAVIKFLEANGVNLATVKTIMAGAYWSIITNYYSYKTEIAINNMEFCASQGKNMWFETQGSFAFVNPDVKCD